MARQRLVIANRGEIARRVLRTARRLGHEVAVVSVVEDLGAPARAEADAVFEVPSFLDAERIVAAASDWGADALHPGYGFLSESPDFAASVEAAGIAFVGPTPETMRALGGKPEARRLAEAAGAPVLPAVSAERAAANEPGRGVGFPCAVKASFGGGGIGIRVVRRAEDLPGALDAASSEARAAFGDGSVYVEKWLDRPRHVEVQVFGDGEGGAIHLGERDCSAQRRRQKLIEIAPAPGVPSDLRRELGVAALRIARESRYRGAGTVEFLLDGDAFWFLEVNARLQVEHPITEVVHRLDLVEAQLALAEGRWPETLPPPASEPDRFEPLEPHGVAMEARVLAESPADGFAPDPAPVRRYREPVGASPDVVLRVDSGVAAGSPVPPGFDSLLAKVIVGGEDHARAAERLAAALEEFVLHGPRANLSFLAAILRHPDLASGAVHAAWVEERVDALAASRLPPEIMERLEDRRTAVALAQAAAGRPLDRGVRVFLSLGEGSSVASPDHLDGAPLSLPGEVLLTGDGGPFPVRAVATDLGPSRGVAVSVLGETRILPPEESEAASSGGDGGAVARAPLAGRVLELRGEPGSLVAVGDVLAVIESMKMHWQVRSPAGGLLGEAEVAAGDAVAAGAVLYRIGSGTSGG